MELATKLKLAGNTAYGERKFVDAVRYYTRAIEVSPAPEPVFFSNRAASKSKYLLRHNRMCLASITRLHVLPRTGVREGCRRLHRSSPNRPDASAVRREESNSARKARAI